MEILTPAMVYWVGIVDKIDRLFDSLSTLSIIFGVAMVIYCLITLSDGDNDNKFLPKAKKYATILLSVGSLALMLQTFIPSSKTLAAMYVLPPIVNNESVQALPSEVLDFVRGYIKQYTTKETDDI